MLIILEKFGWLLEIFSKQVDKLEVGFLCWIRSEQDDLWYSRLMPSNLTVYSLEGQFQIQGWDSNLGTKSRKGYKIPAQQ